MVYKTLSSAPLLIRLRSKERLVQRDCDEAADLIDEFKRVVLEAIDNCETCKDHSVSDDNWLTRCARCQTFHRLYIEN